MMKTKNTKSNIVWMLAVLAGTLVCVCAIVLICRFADLQNRKKVIADQMAPDGTANILVLGDSIWDLERGDTGIASLLEEELDNQVVVYNLAIQGSRSAAVSECLKEDVAEVDIVESEVAGKDISETNVTSELENTNRICLYSMTKYLTGELPCDIPAEYAANDLISEVDLKEMDYVILAYGLNDYFGAVQQKNLTDGFDATTYAGSMCASIRMMQEVNPDLQFVIVSPTYCQGYSYGQVIHESTSHDYGSGTGYDYAMTAKEVAVSFGAIFVDNYEGLGISIHNGAEYLIDATHLSEKGRRAYAKNLADGMVNR